jgi:hypothetical protein
VGVASHCLMISTDSSGYVSEAHTFVFFSFIKR